MDRVELDEGHVMNHWLVRSLLLLAFSSVAMAAPLGSAYTYQGELRVSGQPANGAHDFEVALFNESSGGSPLDTQVVDDLSVTQGLFALTLDYTSVPFASATQYYLELRVRDGASSGAYTTLLPRQPILATPYALHANTVDGTAVVAAAAARPSFATRFIQLVGPPTPLAGDSSITIGEDGLAIVSVYDAANGDLVVIHCDNPGCSQYTQTLVDSAGIVGRGNSIMATRTGFAAISYIDSTNGDLKLARCSNRSCTASTISVVDANVGDSRRSVILTGTGGSLGMVDIVYHDASQGDVEGATCAPNGTCTYATIDSANNVGQSLDAMRTSAQIIVAYRDDTLAALRYKVCAFTLANCALASAMTADAVAVPGDISLVAPPDGRVLLLYVRSGDLRSARCTTPSCPAVTPGPVVIDNVAAVAAVLGADGMPLVLTLDSTYASASFTKCGDFGCNTAFSGNGAGAAAGAVEGRPGITLGAHGAPIATHRSGSSLFMWVCDTPECGQARRR
jgi:hypothetical protein